MEYGMLLCTAGVAEAAGTDLAFAGEVASALARYFAGDWGELCHSDRELNDRALRSGGRLLGAYRTSRGVIWIITEAENDAGRHEATTVLFPFEY